MIDAAGPQWTTPRFSKRCTELFECIALGIGAALTAFDFANRCALGPPLDKVVAITTDLSRELANLSLHRA